MLTLCVRALLCSPVCERVCVCEYIKTYVKMVGLVLSSPFRTGEAGVSFPVLNGMCVGNYVLAG